MASCKFYLVFDFLLIDLINLLINNIKMGFWFNNENLKGRSPFSHTNVDTTYDNTVETISSELMEVMEELGHVVDWELQPLFWKEDK